MEQHFPEFIEKSLNWCSQIVKHLLSGISAALDGPSRICSIFYWMVHILEIPQFADF